MIALRNSSKSYGEDSHMTTYPSYTPSALLHIHLPTHSEETFSRLLTTNADETNRYTKPQNVERFSTEPVELERPLDREDDMCRRVVGNLVQLGVTTNPGTVKILTQLDRDLRSLSVWKGAENPAETLKNEYDEINERNEWPNITRITNRTNTTRIMN